MKLSIYSKSLSQLTLLSAALMLGACSSPTSNSSRPEDSSTNDQITLDAVAPVTPGFEVATTLTITTSDTKAKILTDYGGGTILAWHPTDGSAILGQTTLQANKATGPKLRSKRNNSKTHRVAEAGGIGAWSGGIGAWSGGYGAWSGGIGAWSGGSSTSVSVSNPNVNIFNQIKLAQAQGYAANAGLGVKVAVIDTGIDLAHPAFSGRLVAASEMYDWIGGDSNPQEGFVSGATNMAFGHGTVVAGVVQQIAPNIKIMPLRVLDAEGFGDTTHVVSAIEWAIAKGAKVINISLGSMIEDAAVGAQIKYAFSQGVIVVASSGNTGDTNIVYPAANGTLTSAFGQGLIGVGSVGTINRDVKSAFSTYGTNLEMVAPGENVFSAYPNNQTAVASGTSFAAPMVSAAVALALGQGAQVQLVTKDLAGALNTTLDLVDAVNPSHSGLLGKGRLNLEKFMKKALGLP
jgi:thermitase